MLNLLETNIYLFHAILFVFRILLFIEYLLILNIENYKKNICTHKLNHMILYYAYVILDQLNAV